MNNKKVAIVSYAIEGYQGLEAVNKWSDEVVFSVCKAAMENINLTREEVDYAVFALWDAYEGITIANGLVATAGGAYLKESTRIQNGGVTAILSAYANILAGGADVVVVASADVVKSDPVTISNISYDPYFYRPVGMNYLQSYALATTSYMNKTGYTEQDFALVAAKNYEDGSQNPYAHFRNSYSVEDILNSPYIFWPLRSLELCPISAGACTLILASEKKAKELTDLPIWVSGFGVASNNYSRGLDSADIQKALRVACMRAYKTAKLKNPRKDIDLIEIFNPFSPFEFMAYEALNLCEVGNAVKLLNEGVTSVNGEVPVNVSGGALCTNPPQSGGIFRVIQAAMCLRGEHPNFKKEGAKRAIVHDSDMILGIPGEEHSVIVLEVEV